MGAGPFRQPPAGGGSQRLSRWCAASSGVAQFSCRLWSSFRCRLTIEPTATGGSAFIAQVTLYSAALGLAIAQTCYATSGNHERGVLRQLLSQLDLDGVLIQADALHTHQAFFASSRSRGPTSS